MDDTTALERAIKLCQIIDAKIQGKTIQIWNPQGQGWIRHKSPCWSLNTLYRIKPEPRTFYVLRAVNTLGEQISSKQYYLKTKALDILPVWKTAYTQVQMLTLTEKIE